MDPASFSTFGPAMGLGAGLAMALSAVVGVTGGRVERAKARRLQALVDQMEADEGRQVGSTHSEVEIRSTGAVARPPRQTE